MMPSLEFKKQTGNMIEITNTMCGVKFRTVVGKKDYDSFMSNIWNYVMEVETK